MEKSTRSAKSKTKLKLVAEKKHDIDLSKPSTSSSKQQRRSADSTPKTDGMRTDFHVDTLEKLLLAVNKMNGYFMKLTDTTDGIPGA